MKDNGFVIETGTDKSVLVWGWVAVILAVAVGVGIWQLSAALSTAILILSGGGAGSMMILSVFRGLSWYRHADGRAQLYAKVGKAYIITARRGDSLPVVDYKLLEEGKRRK